MEENEVEWLRGTKLRLGLSLYTCPVIFAPPKLNLLRRKNKFDIIFIKTAVSRNRLNILTELRTFKKEIIFLSYPKAIRGKPTSRKCPKPAVKHPLPIFSIKQLEIKYTFQDPKQPTQAQTQ